MVKASTLVREASSYPLHLGVTEAGDDYTGLVKNSIGIGSLLLSGIGDTIRVSLTADPVEEVRAGMEILSAVGMNARGRVNVVSCPTCGRTRINLIGLMKEYKRRAAELDTHGKMLNVAVMGLRGQRSGRSKGSRLRNSGRRRILRILQGRTACKRVEEDAAVDFLLEETKKALEDGEK